MRHQGSTTRELTDQVIAKLRPRSTVVRDLAEGIELVDEAWINANFTDPQERSEEQRDRLAGSDVLVQELRDADTVVIGMPIYNFGIPGALKAWIDLVARARETFRYTENGPVGLLEGKRAIIVAASGGTELNSGIDFATPYLRHALAFIGIEDVQIVSADRQMANAETARAKATSAIERLAA